MFLMKILKSKIAVAILIGYALLFFIPELMQFIHLSPELTIDWEGFTEEWYRTLVDIGKLLLGFILINIFWENYKKLELASEKNAIRTIKHNKWRVYCSETNTALVNLKESITNNNRVEFQKARESISKHLTLLTFLSDSTPREIKSEVISRIDALILDFNRGPRLALEHILKSISEGTIIPGRHLSQDDQDCFQKSENYFSDVELSFGELIEP